VRFGYDSAIRGAVASSSGDYDHEGGGSTSSGCELVATTASIGVRKGLYEFDEMYGFWHEEPYTEMDTGFKTVLEVWEHLDQTIAG